MLRQAAARVAANPSLQNIQVSFKQVRLFFLFFMAHKLMRHPSLIQTGLPFSISPRTSHEAFVSLIQADAVFFVCMRRLVCSQHFYQEPVLTPPVVASLPVIDQK
jgi:hypothetical protein